MNQEKKKSRAMSKLKNAALSIVAKAAYKSAERSANETCWLFDYQPALPKAVKDLKSHK